MKKLFTATMILAAISLSGGLMIAHGNPMMHGGTPPCTAMDTDGNGSIDQQEFDAFREQRMANAPKFSEIDTNGDGVITPDEMVAMHLTRFGGKGMGAGYHSRPGCMMGQMAGGPGYQAMDEETKAKYDAFMTDTVELRKEIAVKRAEKRAVMRSQNPDPDQAAQLTRELLELRAQMMAKADEAGVDFGPGRGCAGGRMGMMGAGPGHRQGHGGMNGCGGCRR